MPNSQRHEPIAIYTYSLIINILQYQLRIIKVHIVAILQKKIFTPVRERYGECLVNATAQTCRGALANY